MWKVSKNIYFSMKRKKLRSIIHKINVNNLSLYHISPLSEFKLNIFKDNSDRTPRKTLKKTISKIKINISLTVWVGVWVDIIKLHCKK